MFGFGPGSPFSNRWGKAQDQIFELPAQEQQHGDQLFVFCLDDDGIPNFLWGYSYNTEAWLQSGLSDDAYQHGSALPSALQVRGHVTQPSTQADNCVFMGELAGSKASLLSQFVDPNNYRCSSDTRQRTQEDDGMKQDPLSSRAVLAGRVNLAFFMVLVGGFLAVLG